MNNYKFEEEQIRNRASEIRNKLDKIGGVSTIYGVPFDRDNIDHLLIVVYGIGYEEGKYSNFSNYEIFHQRK